MRDPSEDDLDRWMERLSFGEREAFDPPFRALYPRALRLSLVKLSSDQAADAAQAVTMLFLGEAVGLLGGIVAGVGATVLAQAWLGRPRDV